jgi:hypothetical protein
VEGLLNSSSHTLFYYDLGPGYSSIFSLDRLNCPPRDAVTRLQQGCRTPKSATSHHHHHHRRTNKLRSSREEEGESAMKCVGQVCFVITERVIGAVSLASGEEV